MRKEGCREDLERILAIEEGRATREQDSRSQQKGVSQWRGPGVSDAGGRGPAWSLD